MRSSIAEHHDRLHRGQSTCWRGTMPALIGSGAGRPGHFTQFFRRRTGPHQIFRRHRAPCEDCRDQVRHSQNAPGRKGIPGENIVHSPMQGASSLNIATMARWSLSAALNLSNAAPGGSERLRKCVSVFGSPVLQRRPAGLTSLPDGDRSWRHRVDPFEHLREAALNNCGRLIFQNFNHCSNRTCTPRGASNISPFGWPGRDFGSGRASAFLPATFNCQAGHVQLSRWGGTGGPDHSRGRASRICQPRMPVGSHFVPCKIHNVDAPRWR